MDFVTLRDFRTQPGKVWKKLAKARELVVTRSGKPFALLTETAPTSLAEDLAALRRARFGRALSAIREQAKSRGLDELSCRGDQRSHSRGQESAACIAPYLTLMFWSPGS